LHRRKYRKRMQDAVSRSAELQDGTWPRSRAMRRTQRTP